MSGEAAAPAAPKKSKKLLIIVAVVLLVVAGGGYYFFMGSSSKAAEKPKPGDVVAVEPLTLNLTDGHYLKLGLGIRTAEGVDVKKFDPSEAEDIAIAQFSDHTLTDLSSDKARQAMKDKYKKSLSATETYKDQIYDVYYTVFVMQ